MKEFTNIKKNIYIDRKKYAFSDDEAYICQCEEKAVKKTLKEEMESILDMRTEDEYFGCGKSCINKLVSSECVEHLCPAGASCRNRKFQQHLYAEVYPVKTDDRGWGLCAGEFLPKGTFVMQYIGEIYSIDSDYGLEKLKEYRHKTCTYLMEISKKEVIDPTNKGNCARFINHSCEPNCETQKWHVLGEICVGIFTLRDINEGEELTFNYGFNILKTTFQKCLCNTASCKGYLGIVTQNDLPRGNDYSILCDICKVSCKSSEKVLVCEHCKKVLHRSCVKRYRDKHGLINLIIPNEPAGIFYCHHCSKKKLNLTGNILNGITNLSLDKKDLLNNSASSLLKKEKKSSQQLIKEHKLRKRLKHMRDSNINNEEVSGINSISQFNINNSIINENNLNSEIENINEDIIDNINDSIKVITNNINTEEEEDVISVTESSEIISTINNNTNSKKLKKLIKSKSHIKEEKSLELILDSPTPLIVSQLDNSNQKNKHEDLIIEQTIEVEESDLKKIRQNLKNLCTIGARLFWDFRHELSLSGAIEIKITGTPIQIEKVKEQIQKLKQETEVTLDTFSVTINVPQLYVRKIIGHQNRNLISYRAKYNVEIDFDQTLITDEIFPIYDTTQITIKGKENFVKYVESEIKKTIYNLKVITIFLMPADHNYIKNSICQLKTMIDPADLRLRKREYKSEREIKHSFYYIPNMNKDLVIIGFENEITKARRIIREFLLRQNTLEYNYSLCFLCPTFFLNLVNKFKEDMINLIRIKNVLIKIYDPNYSRKHLNIYMEGKWKDIIEIKAALFKYLNDNDINRKDNKKRNGIVEFQQYAFNQEHKLISKNLRKFFLEENYIVKNWDLISDDITQVQENPKIINPFVKNLIDNPETDTTLNYLLNLPSGSYKSVFNMSKLDLTKDLIYHVEEALESYKMKQKSNSQREENIFNTESRDSRGASVVSSNIKVKVEENIINDNINDNINDDVEMEEVVEDLTDDENVNDTIHITNVNQNNVNIINNSTSLKQSSTQTLPQIIPPQFSSEIDNIKNTLLNKLNEMKNDHKPTKEKENTLSISPNNECICLTNNTNNFSKSNSDSLESLKSLDNKYEIKVTPEDLNLLLSKNASTNSVPIVTNQEAMNISYNFSNINQMNININISSFSNNQGEDKNKSEKETQNSEKLNQNNNKYLNKKTKSERSISPYERDRERRHNIAPYKERYTGTTSKNNYSESKYYYHRSKYSSNRSNTIYKYKSRSKSKSSSDSLQLGEVEEYKRRRESKSNKGEKDQKDQNTPSNIYNPNESLRSRSNSSLSSIDSYRRRNTYRNKYNDKYTVQSNYKYQNPRYSYNNYRNYNNNTSISKDSPPYYKNYSTNRTNNIPSKPYYYNNNWRSYYNNNYTTNYTNGNRRPYYKKFNNFRSHSTSRSQSPQSNRVKEFLELKNLNEVNIVEDEANSTFTKEVVELKSCVRKPNL